MESQKHKFPADALGWGAYALGFVLALAGYNLAGGLLCAGALVFLLRWYSSAKTNGDIFKLSFKDWRVVAWLGTGLFLALFWLGAKGIAYLCLGFVQYTYACVCLRSGTVYYGGQFSFRDNMRAERGANPLAYWFWTLGFSLCGAAILVLMPVSKRW